MELPWRIGDDGHVYALHPVLPRVSPGDWASIEEWLGVKLPGDYQEVIGDGPSLVFDDELLISSPFCEMAPLGRRIAWGSWSLACLRQRFPDEFDVALFPEPGGLLWGTDGGGGTITGIPQRRIRATPWGQSYSSLQRSRVILSSKSSNDVAANTVSKNHSPRGPGPSGVGTC